MVSLWGEYNHGPAVRRLFWSLGRAFTCFPNRQPLYHTANDHLFSLFAHQSISRLLALTYFLVHCLSFRSGNIATYMISTSSFLPSFKSFKFHSAHPSGFLSAFLPSPKGCQLLPPCSKYIQSDFIIFRSQMIEIIISASYTFRYFRPNKPNICKNISIWQRFFYHPAFTWWPTM